MTHCAAVIRAAGPNCGRRWPNTSAAPEGCAPHPTPSSSARAPATPSNCWRGCSPSAGPIAVEAYGLFIFREAIAAMGVPTTPIGFDEDGAKVDELDGLDAAAALLTPAHFFPHGVPLHPVRRTAVIDWARRRGRYLLEDDYDGEFRYDRQPVGAVQGLDPQRVAYLGSASKSLSPVLRLGWMALPGRPRRTRDRRRRRTAVLRQRHRSADDGRLHPRAASTTSTSVGCATATVAAATRWWNACAPSTFD